MLKLIISRFEGTALDWFHFWNQYESEIDKQDISPITKFSYLKELLLHQAVSYLMVSHSSLKGTPGLGQFF